MRIGRPLAFAALILLLISVLVLGVLLGNVPLDAGQVVLALLQAIPGLQGVGGPVDPTVSVIVMNIRLPRVLLGIMVGAALGVAGCAMQGLLKNPLADPYLFGVSAGAAVGSAAAAVTGFFILGALTGPAVAFLGALLATALVYQVSRVGGQLPVEGVLLAGVAVGSLLAAIASAIVFFDPIRRVNVIFWLLGSLQSATWTHVAIIAPLVIAGTFALLLFSRPLNAKLLGDEVASSLGVDPKRTTTLVLFLVALLTAAAVAFAGIIGFVGIIVPHTMRLLIGPDHRYLLPASAMFGGVLLAGCDVLARSSVSGIEIPVGILTAFLGAPFFVYLLRRYRRLKSWG
jgi:iron complex transport system permease protein